MYVLISKNYKPKDETQRMINFEVETSENKWSWLTDIFWQRVSSDSSSLATKTVLNKSKLMAFVILLLLNLLTFWVQIESLYYAKIWGVNAGVIMSLFAIKPLISFTMFYFTLGKTISKFEAIGMIISIFALLIISLSKFNFIEIEQNITSENKKYFVFSMMFVVPWIILIWTRNLVYKMYFKSSGPFDEIFIIQILVNFTVSVGMLIIGVFYYIRGFRFEWIDLLYGSIGGILNLIWSLLSVMVVIKGRAGPADALIESSSLFLTLMEAVLFARLPNSLQYFGIGLAFISTLLIIKGSHH